MPQQLISLNLVSGVIEERQYEPDIAAAERYYLEEARRALEHAQRLAQRGVSVDFAKRRAEELASPEVRRTLARSDFLTFGWHRISAHDAALLVDAWNRYESMESRLLAQQLSGGALDIYPKKEYDMLFRKAPRRRVAAQPSARYVPPEVRRAVWERDGGRCRSCGALSDL
jgi:hypothetical protein